MRSSCVPWPKDEPLIIVRQSQLRLCDNNHCAAALLSFFEYWHNIKLGNQEQAEHANRVARQHGEDGKQDTSLFVFKTEKQLEEGLLGLYGRKTIRAALELIVQKGFVSIHDNPNSRYRFDKTHYFLFHPEKVCSQLLDICDEVKIPHLEEANHEEETGFLVPIIRNESPQIIDICDEVKIPDRDGTFAASSGKNASSCGKNASTIPEITSEITPRDLPPLTPQGVGVVGHEIGRNGTTAGASRVLEAKAQHILVYLNTTLERAYRVDKHIKARLRQGFTVEDCKVVIDWLHIARRQQDPEWVEKYLDHTTPFREENFDKYLQRANEWHSEGRSSQTAPDNRPYM